MSYRFVGGGDRFSSLVRPGVNADGYLCVFAPDGSEVEPLPGEQIEDTYSRARAMHDNRRIEFKISL